MGIWGARLARCVIQTGGEICEEIGKKRDFFLVPFPTFFSAALECSFCVGWRGEVMQRGLMVCGAENDKEKEECWGRVGRRKTEEM